VGFENIELCENLIEKRALIQEQCKGIEENLKQEKSSRDYKPHNFEFSKPQVGVTVEHVQVRAGKNGKKWKAVSANMQQKQLVSNYDLLERLGFDKNLIGENKRLGLRERTMHDLNSYMMQHAKDMAAGASIILNEDESKAQVYKEMTGQSKSEIRTEENDDWKYVEITPPPKPPLDKTNLVKIEQLPKFA